MSKHHHRPTPKPYAGLGRGTCERCGKPCDPERYTHDDCKAGATEARDYRKAARQREGKWQRCGECGRTEGQRIRIDGRWQRVKIQRDHYQRLADYGPRDWTVPLCVPCHEKKTRRENMSSSKTKSKKKPAPKTSPAAFAARVTSGAILVCVGLWMLGNRGVDVPTGAPAITTPDPAAMEDVTGWLIRAAYAAAAAAVVAAVVWWARNRMQTVRHRLVDAVCKASHSNPAHVRLRVLRWGWGFRPTHGSLRGYSTFIDDSEHSADRQTIERIITQKVGPSAFRWDTTRALIRWTPGDPATPPMEVVAGEVVDPDAQEVKMRERVQAAAAAAVKGDVTVAWGPAADDGPSWFRIDYPSAFPDASPDQRQTFVERVTAKIPGRFSPTWDTTQNYVRFTRRPPLPEQMPAQPPTSTDTWVLTLGVSETGEVIVWDLRKAPHALIVGAPGSGKSVLLRTLIVGATGKRIKTVGIDPKRIELPGFRDWPGMDEVATTVEEMVEVVNRYADLMDDRYAAIEDGTATEADMDPVLIVLDEFTEFVARVNAHWKATKERGQNGSEHPAVERVRSMARLGRSARIHLCIGIQRPDASILGGEMRDNLRFRVALGVLSAQGAAMVFDRSDVARDKALADLKGRATIQLGGNEPMEVQTFYTPNPRELRNKAEGEHLAMLRAAAQTAHQAPAEVEAAPTPTATPDAPVEADTRRWEAVHPLRLAADDTIRVDRDGVLVEGRFVGACDEPDGTVQVEYVPVGSQGSEYAFLDDDELVERAATALHTR